MLREIRQRKGLTQKELGSMIGKSFQAVSKYEKGVREPNRSTIDKIVDALKLNQKQELELRRSFGKRKEE